MECPVCKTADATEYNTGASDTCRIDCRRCEEFDISRTAMAMLPAALEGGLHRRALMSHTIRRMIGFGKTPPPRIVSDKLDSYWPGEKLPAPGLQADSLILLLGDKQLSPDAGMRTGGNFLGAWLGTSLLSKDVYDGAHWILQHLKSEALLTWSWAEDTHDQNPIYVIQLTMRGWEKYAELKRCR